MGECGLTFAGEIRSRQVNDVCMEAARGPRAEEELEDVWACYKDPAASSQVIMRSVSSQTHKEQHGTDVNPWLKMSLPEDGSLTANPRGYRGGCSL